MKTSLPCSRLAALSHAAWLLCAFTSAAMPAAAQTAPAADHVMMAQLSAPALSDTIVTATRVEQPLSDVLADVTLIDEPEIRRSGAVNIADLLARQPGLELSRNGGPGTTTSLFMRGAETRFTAVYINGVRVDTQSTGGAPWESIALGQVERIEIVRGAAAAVYGSDAVAGVIHIFTKQGEGAFSPYVGAGVGSRRTGRLEAGFSGRSGQVDYALGAERSVSRGYNAKPLDGHPDRDGYRSSAASGRLGWQINPAHRLDVTGTYSHMDAQYDAFTPGRDDHALNRLGTLGATWSAQWSQHYSTRLSVSQSHQRYETDPSPYLTKTALRNYLLHNEWRHGAHLFTAALERREDHLANVPIDQGRHQNALALGYGYTAGVHTLQLNLRHDRDSEFGGHTTGGMAYGYGFAPGWRVTAAAGTSFRVPTLYQRFSEYGQPALEPEKGRNMELGLRYAQEDTQAGVTVYRNRVRNLINFGAAGPCSSAFGCYENTGRASYQGLTLSGSTRLAGFHLNGSLDLQEPKNLNTDRQLARRAKRLLKLAADRSVRLGHTEWTLGAEWQASSHRYDNAANTRRLGGYGLVNLYASTRIGRDWQLLARLDNAGDKQYQLAHGYATAGRTLHVGLRWSPRP